MFMPAPFVNIVNFRIKNRRFVPAIFFISLDFDEKYAIKRLAQNLKVRL